MKKLQALMLTGILSLICYKCHAYLLQKEQQETGRMIHDLFMLLWEITLLVGVVIIAWEMVILLKGIFQLVRNGVRSSRERNAAGAYWKMLLCSLLRILAAFGMMLLLTGMTLGFDI